MVAAPPAEWSVRLRLVGKLALVFAAISTAGLLALVLAVDDDLGLGYGTIIGSRLRSQARLDLTLWFFGLLLAALSGLSTWLLALYASFRFAGPMFRFSRNIELLVQHGPVVPQPLRRDDLLQSESAQLRAAADSLRQHYQLLRVSLDRWRVDPGPESAGAVVSCLQALDSRVRL
jgi:hypothetical protein